MGRQRGKEEGAGKRFQEIPRDSKRFGARGCCGVLRRCCLGDVDDRQHPPDGRAARDRVACQIGDMIVITARGDDGYTSISCSSTRCNDRALLLHRVSLQLARDVARPQVLCSKMAVCSFYMCADRCRTVCIQDGPHLKPVGMVRVASSLTNSDGGAQSEVTRAICCPRGGARRTATRGDQGHRVGGQSML